MSRIVNVKPIGAYDDEFRILAFAENLTTGVVKLFSFVGAMPDKSLSMSFTPILGKDKNTNDIFISNGLYGATTTAEQVVTENEFSFQLNKDFNTEINELDPTVCRDVLQAIISGEKFKYDGDEWIVIGTNGARYIGKLSTTDVKYFFLEEGKLTVPNAWDENGEKLLIDNGKAAPFSDTALVAFESTGYFGTDQRKGFRVPYAFETEKMFNQDTAADNYGTTMKRLSDVRFTDGSIYDTLTDPQELSTTDTKELKRVQVDYVIEVSGGGVPTIAGASAGTTVAVIDSDDGTVTLYKHDGTSFDNTAVTSGLAEGAVIRAEKFDTALDGSTVEDKVVLVAIKQAGANGSAVAVNLKTNPNGTGNDTYVCELMDFDYATATFVNYQA